MIVDLQEKSGVSKCMQDKERTTSARTMSPGRKLEYILTRSFSAARTSCTLISQLDILCSTDRITPVKSSIVGTSLITTICTRASRILIRVTRPKIIFPSFGSSDVCICCVFVSLRVILSIGRPFLDVVEMEGPRIEALISSLEGDCGGR
jgi:hypothetical protein